MAAPSFVGVGTGVVITTGSSAVSKAGCTVGNFMVLQVLEDGTGSGVAGVSYSGVAHIDGTANSMLLAAFEAVGSPTAANQRLYLGRATGTTVTATVTTGGDDLYCRVYELTNVSTGTTLATVVENSTAGTMVNGVGTSTTVSDTGVTTIGVDRLAANFGGINDDATGIAVFTGATGGTWTNFQSFESATGTDGTVFYEDCSLASAGTINGGSATITSDGWGVIGFAFIGTTVSTLPPHKPERALQAVNRSSVY